MTIQSQREIGESWRGILAQVGYVHDHCYNLSDKPEVARKLGEVLFDYMTASIYDCGWEGFEDDELKGVAVLLSDMNLAVEKGLLK